MPTYDYTQGGPAPVAKGDRITVVEREIDIAAIAAARAAAGQAALAQNDVLQAIKARNCWVSMVNLIVEKAEGEAMTVDVGDGADTDGFLNDVDCNALGRAQSLATTAYSVAVGGGRYYGDTEDTIDVLLNSAITYSAAKLRLQAVMIDLRRDGV